MLWIHSYSTRFHIQISALQMPGKNCNRFESPLGVWTNQYTKPPEYLCLLNKLLLTVGCFNLKLLHNWSNFDLPKLMSVLGGGGGGTVDSSQVTGMIDWGKYQNPQKIPGPKFKPQKIPCRISEP